jgi:hypothetical protein
MSKSWNLPHALYRMFDAAGALLYVGCSARLCGRLAHHGASQPWHAEISKITVEWIENELLGRQREAAVILNERPRYNRLQLSPNSIGTKEQKLVGRRPRGSGTRCPKCGAPKEDNRPGKAYCNACYRIYAKLRRLRATATPV